MKVQVYKGILQMHLFFMYNVEFTLVSYIFSEEFNLQIQSRSNNVSCVITLRYDISNL
jgi:hypothetical protein